MNREGAETYLRLLGEAELRGSLTAATQRLWAGGPGISGGGRAKLIVVGQALIAVGALDAQTAEDIVADFDLAVSVRLLHEQTSQGPGPAGAGAFPAGTLPAGPLPAGALPAGTLPAGTLPAGTLPAGTLPAGALPAGAARPGRMMRAAAVTRWTAQAQFGGPGSPTGASMLARAWPAGSSGSLDPADPKASKDPAQPKDPEHPEDPGQGPDQGPDRGRADRFVPVGLTIPFHGEDTSGELYLMSFAQTGSGARFIAAWGMRTLSLPHPMGLAHPDLKPFELFTVTDDRGARYDVDFMPGGREWTCEISLHPTPPDDIRWLDVAAPLRPTARVELTAGSGPADDEPAITEAKLSPGEHLLIMLAEHLLTMAPEYSRNLRRQVAAMSPGPWHAMTAGLGAIVAGLEAADLLSPLSPVLARLAALCASLRIDGSGIAATPADDLPEPWLSLLAHYQRRKPDVAPVRDGYAAAASALPELDGIRLVLLGVLNTEGSSSLHVLAQGMTAEGHPGPLGIDLDFPLSIWLRDSGGRWHAARPARWQRAGLGNSECVVRLRLVPPLTGSTRWVEVLAAGRSAEVRTRLALRWGDPP
jgi:hypothetical protein